MRAIIVLPLAMLLAATSTAKDVTIKVTPEMETFSDAPVFKIMVTNESGDYVSVLGPSIDLPPELYPDQPTFSPDRQFDLPDGAFREIQVPGPPMSRREILHNAFLRPKSYDAPVRVRYKQGDDNSVRNTAQQPATLAPLAPWWAVTLGAMVGVVAVLSFRYLSGRVQKRAASAAKPQPQPQAPSPAPPPVQVGGGAAAAPAIAAPVPPAAAEPQPEPTSWWGLLLLGWLVVIMAVLIFRFTSTQFPDLPITVNVKDVYGGFALGLVFQPLVHFFSQTLA